MFKTNLFRALLASAALLGTADLTFGQAAFVETFDDLSYPFTGLGPYELLGRGWVFRMQSLAATYGAAPWADGPSWGETPQAGTSCLAAWHYDANLSGSAQISNWAIIPPIPFQQTGDVLSIWLRLAPNAAPAGIEIRYSPTGGTSTGNGPGSVGDFSTSLLAVNPVQSGPWMQYQTTLPGAGRLALRFVGNHAYNQPAALVLIDSLTIGAPCPLPPLPLSGQTITWSLAGSPYTLCRDAEIVAGGTVVVAPGVEVRVPLGTSLRVLGTLRAVGTSASPCVLTTPGATAGNAGTIDIAGGRVMLTDCDVNLTLLTYKNSVLSCERDRFYAGGLIHSAPNSFLEVPHTVALKDCTFNGGTAVLSDANVAMRNVQFANPGPVFVPSILRGFVVLDNVTVNGSSFWVNGQSRDDAPYYFRGLHVNGIPSDPALLVTGNNIELRSDCTFQNSLVPVQLYYGAGLLPGTSIPGSGNVNNHVRLGRPNYPGQGVENAKPVLANVGVPYVAEANGNNQTVPIFSGSMTVLPGATILMKPNTYWEVVAGSLLLRGLPNAPITFDRFDPNTPWGGFGYAGDQRIENCIIRGSTSGTIPGQNSGALRIDNSLYENNLICTRFNVTVKKTLFQNNTAVNGLFGGGNFNGQTNPNAFVSNGETIHDAADARFNWWGDASGPSPFGLGNPIGANVPFSPVLAAAPDFTNAPPVVNIHPPSFHLEAGRKIMLTWDVIDEGPLATQTVSFSDPVNGESVIAANLVGSQRSLEWTVPAVPGYNGGGYHVIKVRAFDMAGQEGYDELVRVIPAPLGTTQLALTSNFDGQTFRCGQQLPPITWTSSGLSTTVDFQLIDDNTGRIVPGGGTVMNAGVWSLLYAPNISSDHVRLFLRVNESGGNRYHYVVDGPFAIRPDPLLGDAPPLVQLTSPAPGASYQGGGTVPIAWSATDNDALRSFQIQASFDDGRSWDTLVLDLPGTSQSFNWVLPPSAGDPAVLLRVIAADLRFQTSSVTLTAPIAILPGPCSSGLCTSFCSGDGTGTACPCGNSGVSGRGCASSVNASGALLTASGAARATLANDTCLLSATGVPNGPGLYFQGSAPLAGGLGSPFGDGLLCAGSSVIRLGVVMATGNTSTFPSGQTPPNNVQISVRGLIAAGDVRNYQLWYRDGASFCTASTFNLTNAIGVTWAP